VDIQTSSWTIYKGYQTKWYTVNRFNVGDEGARRHENAAKNILQSARDWEKKRKGYYKVRVMKLLIC
jgi:hypothetical protein